MDLDKVDLMTEADSLRRGWQACQARLAAVEAERDAAQKRVQDCETRMMRYAIELAEMQAERDAARAGEARAVECLKEIDDYNGGADSVLEDEYVTHRRMEVIEVGASSLAWLAQQRREAAAEALDRLSGEWWAFNDEYIASELSARAAALRAGEVGNE